MQKLKSVEKEYVHNKLNDLLPLNKKKIADGKQITDNAQFICNNCGYTEKIKAGTLIFSKYSNDISQSYSTDDSSIMEFSDILPRTRKYKCPNSECVSHNDLSKREATFFRMNNNVKIKYICNACHTSFY